jgi:copper chaperone CopZ
MCSVNVASEKTSEMTMQCSEHCSNAVRDKLRKSPPPKWSVKVTDCRETQDVLVRDQLEATASVINCVGGVNGKRVAVVKSLLIDLESVTGNADGNKAQAEAEMLLAA